MTTEMIGFLAVGIAVVGVGVALAVLVVRLHTVSEKRSDDAHGAIGRNIDGLKTNLSDLKKDVGELKVQSAKNSTDLGWIKHYLGKEKL